VGIADRRARRKLARFGLLRNPDQSGCHKPPQLAYKRRAYIISEG